MAETPKSIKVNANSRALANELRKTYDEGFNMGLEKGRQEILDWLQFAYIDDNGRPDRGTPKAEAILELARDAATHFMAKKKRKGGRRR